MTSSTVLLVVDCCAACASLAMTCSPSISLYRIHKQRSVGVASVIPLVTLLANSHVWMLYGYLTRNWFPVFSIFVFGDLAGLCYLAVYWRYTTEHRYVARVLLVLGSILLAITIYVVLGALDCTNQTRAQVGTTMGYVCDVVAVCLYSAPMERLFQVLKYRSAVFINVHMVIAGTINNCFWFTYGLLSHNWFIICPNILFMTLGVATLGLYAAFNPATHPLPDSFHIDDQTTDSDGNETHDPVDDDATGWKSTSPNSPAFTSIKSPPVSQV